MTALTVRLLAASHHCLEKNYFVPIGVIKGDFI